MRLALPLSFILLMLLSVSGCGHMPVASMITLARLDLQTTDPEKLRVAVKLPRMLKARAEGTMLRVGVRLANGETETHDFALREVNERDALAAEVEAGTEISTWAIAAGDIMQLRAFRAGLTARQRQTGGSGGAITIAVQPEACRTEPLPNGPVLFSTYLKTGETGGYVPLARDLDLRRVDPNRDLAALVRPCGSA